MSQQWTLDNVRNVRYLVILNVTAVPLSKTKYILNMITRAASWQS